MNNIIKELLDLINLDDAVIEDAKVDNAKRIKTLVIEKVFPPIIYPECSKRMESKGFCVSTLNILC